MQRDGLVIIKGKKPIMQPNVRLSLTAARSVSLRRTKSTILPILFLLAGALNAKAECKLVPNPFNFNPGGTTDIAFYTQRNTSCTLSFQRNPYAYFKMKVTKRPRGFYGISNAIRGLYQPPRDYVGDDYFELHLDYQRLGVGQDRNQALLRVTVKIAE